MSEETEELVSEDESEELEESIKKPRFKMSKPDPIIYFLIGPFILTFIVYIVLTKLLIPSNLAHEVKLEKVMSLANDHILSDDSDNLNLEESDDDSGSGEEAGFLDTHNYFQFPVAFAVNIPDTQKNLTFELAVSSFQSGVTAEWFFESFVAFVPAIRSDILYFIGSYSLKEIQSPDFQKALLEELKNVINAKLKSLGAKPEISKVLFISFIIT